MACSSSMLLRTKFAPPSLTVLDERKVLRRYKISVLGVESSMHSTRAMNKQGSSHHSHTMKPTCHSRLLARISAKADKSPELEGDGDADIEDGDGWGKRSFDYEAEMDRRFPGSSASFSWNTESDAPELNVRKQKKKTVERPWQRKDTTSSSSQSTDAGARPARAQKAAEKGKLKPKKAMAAKAAVQETGEENGSTAGNPEPLSEKRRAKVPKIKPQVQFTAPMAADCQVAIIGGGISGIVCALTLAQNGIKSTIFDSGKHGLGGRMATRHLSTEDGRAMTFDHAAQFFTVSDPRFRSMVDSWQQLGLVTKWDGSVGTLTAGGNFSLLPEGERLVGVGGMRQLCDQLVKQSDLISVRRPVWISNMDAKGDSWHLTENRRQEGQFDAVVIAHNGKCANRLLAPAGVPSIARQMRRLELSSIWALMAAFEDPLPPPASWQPGIDGAFVEGVGTVAWMCHNGAKLVLPASPLNCWTFLSSANYARANKVPQEAIPKSRAAKVKADMLTGVALALGVDPSLIPPPVYSRVQLWGAALPLNAPGVECIFDSVGRVGVCGDWLLSPSIEGAALSGMAMADQICLFRDRGGEGEEFSVGLDASFGSVGGHDIGLFPGMDPEGGERIESRVLDEVAFL